MARGIVTLLSVVAGTLTSIVAYANPGYWTPSDSRLPSDAVASASESCGLGWFALGVIAVLVVQGMCRSGDATRVESNGRDPDRGPPSGAY